MANMIMFRMLMPKKRASSLEKKAACKVTTVISGSGNRGEHEHGNDCSGTGIAECRRV